MLKLPDLERNAHLYVLITQSRVIAHLAYGDYTVGRSYILKDILSLPLLSSLYEKDFWVSYFNSLEKVFNWNIFRGNSGEVMNFATEGIGVTGVSIILIDRLMSSHNLISAVRGYSQDIKIQVVGRTYTKELMDGLCERLGYSDLMVLDLNVMDFTLNRVRRESRKTLSSLQSSAQEVFEGKIRWSEKFKLMEAIRSGKFRAFLSMDSSGKRISNTWANFVNLQPTTVGHMSVVDLLRAFTTVQLLSITNNNGEKFKNIGSLVDGTALIITGDMIERIPKNLLIMSILDGLEVRGGLDIFFDPFGLFYTLGKNYTQGFSNTEYVASTSDFIEDVYKVVVPEIEGDKRERKVVFTGVVNSETGREDEIFAVAPELTLIKLNGNSKRLSIEGNFIKGGHIEGYGEKISFLSNPQKVEYKGLVIDGRYKPIVYGPEPRANRDKINEWFDENTWQNN